MKCVLMMIMMAIAKNKMLNMIDINAQGLNQNRQKKKKKKRKEKRKSLFNTL